MSRTKKGAASEAAKQVTCWVQQVGRKPQGEGVHVEPSLATALFVPVAIGVVIPERSFGEGYWTAVKTLERDCYLGDETIPSFADAWAAIPDRTAGRRIPRAELRHYRKTIFRVP